MKITKQRLKQIIKEELSKVLDETTDITGDGTTDLEDVEAVVDAASYSAQSGAKSNIYHEFMPKSEAQAKNYFYDYVADKAKGLFAEYNVEQAIDMLIDWMKKNKQYFDDELAQIGPPPEYDGAVELFSKIHQERPGSRGLGQ